MEENLLCEKLFFIDKAMHPKKWYLSFKPHGVKPNQAHLWTEAHNQWVKKLPSENRGERTPNQGTTKVSGPGEP